MKRSTEQHERRNPWHCFGCSCRYDVTAIMMSTSRCFCRRTQLAMLCVKTTTSRRSYVGKLQAAGWLDIAASHRFWSVIATWQSSLCRYRVEWCHELTPNNQSHRMNLINRINCRLQYEHILWDNAGIPGRRGRVLDFTIYHTGTTQENTVQ